MEIFFINPKKKNAEFWREQGYNDAIGISNKASYISPQSEDDWKAYADGYENGIPVYHELNPERKILTNVVFFIWKAIVGFVRSHINH